jgi:hypothetical protein
VERVLASDEHGNTDAVIDATLPDLRCEHATPGVSKCSIAKQLAIQFELPQFDLILSNLG